MIQHEQQLLKLVTLYPDQLLECGDLESKHFSNGAYGLIFDKVNEMYDAKKPISMSGISAEINEEWVQSALVELVGVSVDGRAQTLSEAIVDSKIGQSVLDMFEASKHKLSSGRGQRDTVGFLIEEFAKIADDKNEGRLETMDAVMHRAVERVKNPVKTEGKCKTGISLLDSWLGGFQDKLLYIVSGVPSMGKSLFMANLICNIALSGKHVHVGSLEDTSLQIAGRILSRLSGVDAEPIVKCENLSFEEIKTIERTLERISDSMKNIHIDDSTGQSVSSIRRTCAKLKSRGELDISFIDHMGEMKAMGKDKYTAATMNAEGISAIARDIGIPVVAGCQVSKAAVSGSNPTQGLINHENFIPRGHHLRDSGRIQEIARCIMFVHRPHKWDNKMDPSDFWVNIDKQTHGKTGVVQLKTALETMAVISPEEYNGGTGYES